MNKVHAKRSRIYIMILALVLVLVSGKTPVFAETVNDFAGLKAAVERGDKTIRIDGNITVTETLVIDNKVSITGGDPHRREFNQRRRSQ